MDFIRSRNGIERLRKKATDRGLIENLDLSFILHTIWYLIDSFYNIKISRMPDVPILFITIKYYNWCCDVLIFKMSMIV
jgi:hypothetical protein